MGYLAIVSKSELLLLAVGFIFVLETVSVILQVGSYKLRQKSFSYGSNPSPFLNKRLEKNKIIVRFWIISFMANLIALSSLKLR